jgi:hypothetical protein
VTHRTTASPSDSPCQESDSGGGRRLGGGGGVGEEGDDSGRAGGRAGSGRVRVWGCRGGRPPPAIDEVGEGGAVRPAVGGDAARAPRRHARRRTGGKRTARHEEERQGCTLPLWP